MKRSGEGVEQEPAPPSKSQRKRDHRLLQTLAESLIALPDRKLRELALAERTREALQLARTMSPSGARNRQLRLIAKLLEGEDLEKLQRPADEVAEASRIATALHHRAERLRERLLAGDDGVLEEIARSAPGAIPARLRELRELARDPLGGNRARRANRDIFRALLETVQGGSGT